MSTRVSLGCRCGNLRGVATDVAPEAGAHLTCYCDDCQAFARFLGPPGVLNAAGGTDIFPMAHAHVSITEGVSALRCVRLSASGMFRWYAGCCRTPIANSLGGKVPLVSIIHNFMDFADGRARDQALGTPVGIYGSFAIGGMPANAHRKAPIGFVLRAARLALTCWIKGLAKPSAFFDEKNAPRVEPQVLRSAERAALTSR